MDAAEPTYAEHDRTVLKLCDLRAEGHPEEAIGQLSGADIAGQAVDAFKSSMRHFIDTVAANPIGSWFEAVETLRFLTRTIEHLDSENESVVRLAKVTAAALLMHAPAAEGASA